MVEKLFPGLPSHYQSSYSLLQVLQQKWLSLTITIIITIVFIIILLLLFFFIIDYLQIQKYEYLTNKEA